VKGQRHASAALYPGKDPVPIVQEAGWAPGPVWTGAQNLALSGIRSSDYPARSQSLYRLSYQAHKSLPWYRINVNQSYYMPGKALKVPGF